MIDIAHIIDARGAQRIIVGFGHDGELNDHSVSLALRKHFDRIGWHAHPDEVSIATSEPLATVFGINTPERAGEVVKTVIETLINPHSPSTRTIVASFRYVDSEGDTEVLRRGLIEMLVKHFGEMGWPMTHDGTDCRVSVAADGPLSQLLGIDTEERANEVVNGVYETLMLPYRP